jgi:hypothetical protein
MIVAKDGWPFAVPGSVDPDPPPADIWLGFSIAQSFNKRPFHWFMLVDGKQIMLNASIGSSSKAPFAFEYAEKVSEQHVALRL